MDEPGIAVEVVEASKTFPNAVAALAPVSLAVREGEFVCIIGPSGCGKTTLLRMIAGLIAPSAGAVRLWPERAGADSPGGRPAFVFQSPTLMAWANVERNVGLPLRLARTDRAQAAARIGRALALVGLEEFRYAYPRELSGGMQMRVSIARALATDPGLLLMDEPFGALDEITRGRLDRDLLELWARDTLTVVFVTHSIYEAVSLATRIVVMSARPGRLLGEVRIDEPHPRSDAFRLSEDFALHGARVGALLASACQPELGRAGAR